MKSSVVFMALVGFAILNTAFLGAYVFSSTGLIGGASLGPDQGAASSTTTQETAAATTMGTSTSTETSPGSSSSQAVLSTGASGSSATVTNTGTSTSVPSYTVSTTTGTVTMSTMSTTTTTTAAVSGVATETLSNQSTPPASSASSQSSSSNSSALANVLTVTQSQLTSSSALQSSAGPAATATPTGSKPGSTLLSLLLFFEAHSLALAPGSWVAVGGMWIWRGRMRSRWTDFGFDSDVFGLFVKMKGGKTRIRLLDALSLPKDRLQLAQELGLDWKGVDRHLMLMKKYGFVDDKVAYGKVRMYELTPLGVSLLKLLQELSREERREEADEPRHFEN